MLTIENLTKTFTTASDRRDDRGRRIKANTVVAAIDDVSLTIEEGELFTLLGPSGCGKTTTLRSVAGLERPDAGEIRVGGRVLFAKGEGHAQEVPVNRRGLGMVFQSYAIWPHMSVFDNTAFPLKVGRRAARPSRAQIEERVMRVLALMELDHLAGRTATKLSGGQQQRLALARALVIEPKLLLLDEPLSNLDARLRENLRFELKRLQRELGITSVYVTHDQVEALALSSRIAVMSGGRVQQVGTPREIYTRPESKFVAEFIGNSNFLDGTVTTSTATGVTLDTPIGPLDVEAEARLDLGAEVLIGIRPESIHLHERGGAAGPNTAHGTVAARSYLGEAVDHIVDVAGRELRARVNPSISFAQGTPVTVQVPADAISIVPKEA
ncbi:ABC transporter ATP-binding protein [Agromyces sp. SYSU T00194]|uniref:ABC transporter ATP-binding protein n=1 Tax=Agromyces chitinivorans TaxID=3158560 RepID=UPI003392C708